MLVSAYSCIVERSKVEVTMPFKAQIRNVSYVDQRVDLILTLQ